MQMPRESKKEQKQNAFDQDDLFAQRKKPQGSAEGNNYGKPANGEQAGKKDKKKAKERGDKSNKGEKRGKGGKSAAKDNARSPFEGLPPREPMLRPKGPAELLQAVAGNPDSSKAAGQTGKRKGKGSQMLWWWWVKLVLVIAFIAGYAFGVVYLAQMFFKAKSSAESGDNSVACKRLQCPSDSVCVVNDVENGRAMCSENSYQNLQILQIVLGIVVGVPSLIVLPCSLQWFVNTGGPWLCGRYTDQKRRMRVASTAKGMQKAGRSSEVLATGEEDLEPGEIEAGGLRERESQKVGFLCRLLGCRGRKPKAGADTALSADSPVDTAAAVEDTAAAQDGATKQENAADVPEEDPMSAFFASVPTKKKEVPEDDFLDSIFASKRNAPPPIGGGDDGLEPPDEDLWGRDDGLDALFSKPPPVKVPAGKQGKGAGSGGEDFDDFFHRPPGRAKEKQHRKEGAMPAMPSSAPTRQRGAGDCSSEVSAGLSAIFAAAKKGPGPASRVSGSCMSGERAASVTSSAAQEEEEYDDGDYDEEDDDYGEAPDFIGFALGIARKTGGTGDDESGAEWASAVGARSDCDARSNASAESGQSGVDSLADLESSPLKELFHAPV